MAEKEETDHISQSGQVSIDADVPDELADADA